MDLFGYTEIDEDAMSYTFTKLFSGLTESTVWVEPYATRVLWVSLLSWADQNGRVFGSLPGIARRAGINLEECEAAMVSFMSPDRHSRTPDHEGRRVEKIEGGWRLLNHTKYRAMRDPEERREYMRLYMNEYRKKEGGVNSNRKNVSQSKQELAQAEAEAEAEVKTRVPTVPVPAASSEDPNARQDQVPYERIVGAYHELLPMLPKVAVLTNARRARIRQRWKSGELPDLETWRKYFAYVATSKFLTGQSSPANGRDRPFVADFEWLCKEANFVKVWEGRYHRGAAA